MAQDTLENEEKNLETSIWIIATAVAFMMASKEAASEDWVEITSAENLRALLIGNGIENGEFADYYHDENVMVYNNKLFDTSVIRTWEIGENGNICMYMYAKPDRLVECNTIARSADDPDKLRLSLTKGIQMTGRLNRDPDPAWEAIVEQALRNDKQ